MNVHTLAFWHVLYIFPAEWHCNQWSLLDAGWLFAWTFGWMLSMVKLLLKST